MKRVLTLGLVFAMIVLFSSAAAFAEGGLRLKVGHNFKTTDAEVANESLLYAPTSTLLIGADLILCDKTLISGTIVNYQDPRLGAFAECLADTFGYCSGDMFFGNRDLGPGDGDFLNGDIWAVLSSNVVVNSKPSLKWGQYLQLEYYTNCPWAEKVPFLYGVVGIRGEWANGSYASKMNVAWGDAYISIDPCFDPCFGAGIAGGISPITWGTDYNLQVYSFVIGIEGKLPVTKRFSLVAGIDWLPGVYLMNSSRDAIGISLPFTGYHELSPGMSSNSSGWFADRAMAYAGAEVVLYRSDNPDKFVQGVDLGLGVSYTFGGGKFATDLVEVSKTRGWDGYITLSVPFNLCPKKVAAPETPAPVIEPKLEPMSMK